VVGLGAANPDLGLCTCATGPADRKPRHIAQQVGQIPDLALFDFLPVYDRHGTGDISYRNRGKPGGNDQFRNLFRFLREYGMAERRQNQELN
jgi:hypothetical protein